MIVIPCASQNIEAIALPVDCSVIICFRSFHHLLRTQLAFHHVPFIVTQKFVFFFYNGTTPNIIIIKVVFARLGTRIEPTLNKAFACRKTHARYVQRVPLHIDHFHFASI